MQIKNYLHLYFFLYLGSMIWKCDGDTLKFWPEKPETEGCKHEWINDIDKSVSKRIS